MKTYTKPELDEILRLHALWLRGESGGERADLSQANLSGANLSRANLSGANLSGANLSGADLDIAAIRSEPWGPLFLARSQVLCAGELVVFKKVRGAILELKVPADAFRQNAIGSRKCRVNKAFVVRALNERREEIQEREFKSKYDEEFIYRMGEWVEESTPDDYTLECGPGIHCFATFEEAVGYE